jgi:hypothetical protein
VKLFCKRYANVKTLTLEGGPIDTTVNVQSTPAGMPVTVNTSTGTRPVTVGSTGGGTVNQEVGEGFAQNRKALSAYDAILTLKYGKVVKVELKPVAKDR